MAALSFCRAEPRGVTLGLPGIGCRSQLGRHSHVQRTPQRSTCNNLMSNYCCTCWPTPLLAGYHVLSQLLRDLATTSGSRPLRLLEVGAARPI